MEGAMGIWDALFGDKVEIELPDGSKRRVTKRWLDEMMRCGKARELNPPEVLRQLAETARVRATELAKSPAAHAERLGSQILLVSVQEVPRLMDLWRRDLEDEAQVLLFAEYTALLIAYVDRLALGKFGEPKRSEFTNRVIDQVKREFCNQHCWGNTESERGDFYEGLIAERLDEYAPSHDLGSHVAAAASRFVGTFCGHIPESEHASLAMETGKELIVAVHAAVAVLPGFKALAAM